MRLRPAALATMGLLGLMSVPSLAQQSGIDSVMDTEFRNQWGLRWVRAQYPLYYGYTGKGVNVVVVDGAIQTANPEFAGKMGRFIYNPGNFAPDNHGTHVAGIIGALRNNEGMEGVAPDAILNSIAIFNPSGPSLNFNQYAPGYNRAIKSGLRFFNNSWGLTYPGRPVNTMSRAGAKSLMGKPLFDALDNSVKKGAVQVWATGNNALSSPDANANADMFAGLPYLFPQLQRGWIAVTSIDWNEKKYRTANGCGVAKAWCIAAPGVSIWSTGASGSNYPYYTDTGTSMATPHVTGALAVAKQMFPRATPQQLARIVLRTARDIGKRGLDNTFGWGALDLANLMKTYEVRPLAGSAAARDRASGGGSQSSEASGGTYGSGSPSSGGAPGPYAEPDIYDDFVYTDEDDGDDNGSVFVNSAYARFAAVDTLMTTLWDRSAQRILHRGPAIPSVAQAIASAQSDTPPMALGGPVAPDTDLDDTVMLSTGHGAAVWAQGVAAHARIAGSPSATADLGGAIGGYDVYDDGNLSGGFAISFTQSNLDTKGTGDDGSAEGWHGFAYATYEENDWFLDGIAGGNWFSNDYTRTTIGGTAGTVLGNEGIAGYSSNDTTGFAGRLTGGHVFDVGPHRLAPYAYVNYIQQRTGGSTEVGADIFSLEINSSRFDQVEGGIGARAQMGGITYAGCTIAPAADLAYGRLGGDVDLPVAFSLLGNGLEANAADIGRNVFRVGGQLDVMRLDDMVGGFIAYDGRFQENAQNNTFSGGILVRF